MSNKLTPKLDKCFFVGYPRKTKGYYFYNNAEGKVFVTRNGIFQEKELVGASCKLKKFKKHPKMFPLCTTMNEPTKTNLQVL
jgi:hypothetical protein